MSAAHNKMVEFGGRVVIIGCGSIGQGILPLIGRHIPVDGKGKLTVLSADEQGRGLARKTPRRGRADWRRQYRWLDGPLGAFKGPGRRGPF